MTERAAIYCRISKDVEGLGLGVERQTIECRALAERRDLDVVDVYVDNDISAYAGKARPEFARMVDDMKAGRFDVVLAWHPDRLTRRPTELEALIEVLDATGVPVVTVAAGEYDLSTSAGRLAARIVGAVARAESETKSDRLKSKAAQAATMGTAPGGPTPYGYRRVNGAYVADEAESEAVRSMAEAVLAGRSLLSIARDLDARGVPTRRGKPWHHGSVRALLINPAIAGLRVHQQRDAAGNRRSLEESIAGPGEWEPILDRATWETLRNVLADPARKRKRPPGRYLLSGVLVTPEGDRMTGNTNAAGRRAYRSASGRSQIAADEVDALIVEALLQRFDDVALPVPGEAPAASDEVAAIEAELAELADVRGAGEITMAEWLRAREGIEARLLEARQAIQRPAPVDPLLSRPGALRGAWPALSFDEQHRLLRAALRRVVVRPASNPGRWATVVDRLDPEWT
jgi:site-specific DNA recombinase